MPEQESLLSLVTDLEANGCTPVVVFYMQDGHIGYAAPGGTTLNIHLAHELVGVIEEFKQGIDYNE